MTKVETVEVPELHPAVAIRKAQAMGLGEFVGVNPKTGYHIFKPAPNTTINKEG